MSDSPVVCISTLLLYLFTVRQALTKTSIKTDIVPFNKLLFTYHDSYQQHLQRKMAKIRHVLEEKDTEAVLASSCHSHPNAGSFIIIK